ncbi:MAG: hypothetical protein ABSA96_11230 [Candidatus Acidiferrales bacterium]|jgi:hypothetical protein
MRSHGKIPYYISFGIILACAGLLFAQSTQDRTLFVNGKSFGTVAQIDGHSYVDIETLTQITGGTVTIEPNRILLTIIGSGSESNAAPPPQPPPPGLSRGFASAAISELAEMREWRGAIGTILTYNVPVVGTWPQDYRDHVNMDLSQVGLVAATSSDQNAFQLLRNEFGNLDEWADQVVSNRNSMNATNTVTPNALQNDQTLAKITDCGRFLNSMLVSGAFADNASCH